MLTCKLKGRRGSIIVDAALSLPIFIIAMGIILMLIAQAGREDTVFSSMTAASAYAVDAVAATGDGNDDGGTPGKAAAYAAYSLGMRTSLLEEWDEASARMSFLDFDCSVDLSGGCHLDDLIHAQVKFDTRIPVIGTFIRGNKSSRALIFRPWVGESGEMEDYDDTRVYIFPKRGEHYHNSSCSCLKNGEIQVVLTSALRKQYAGCQTCHSGTLPNGAAVFLMSAGSTAYHRKSCPCITKAFECVALSDAVSMGYTPCGLCGGTPQNYDPALDHFK